MKNLFNFSVLLLIILSSCENSLQEFKFEDKGIFAGLVNPEDSIDQNMNVALFQTANAIKELAISNNDNFRAKLLKKLIENENTSISISELFDEKTIGHFNKKIRYRSLGQDISNLSEMSKSMNYLDVNYTPALSLYKSLDQNKEFSGDKLLIAVAAEVEQEEMIPGWEINGQSVKEILIGEEDIHPKTPLILVQNHSNTPIIAKATGEEIWGRDTLAIRSNAASRSSNIKIVWDDYQIKNGHRYEKSGRSEINFGLVIYKPEAPYWDLPWNELIKKAYGVNGEVIATIKKIKKNDIKNSKLFTDDKTFVENHPMALYTVSQASYYAVVYEHDWYASKKSVQSCISNQLQMKVRMKYSHEWYYVDYCAFSARNSWVGASFTVNNNKCRLTLKRTQ